MPEGLKTLTERLFCWMGGENWALTFMVSDNTSYSYNTSINGAPKHKKNDRTHGPHFVRPQ